MSNFMRIHPTEAELFHAQKRDRWTYMTRLTVTFHILWRLKISAWIPACFCVPSWASQ